MRRDLFSIFSPGFGGFPLLGNKKTGLRLSITNNGDDTATLNWSGFNLTAIDPDGRWEHSLSTDGVSYGTPVQLADNVFTDDISIPDPATVYYVKLQAIDSGDTVLKEVIRTITTGNDPVTSLNITNAVDDGSGTAFDLTIAWDNPVGYTDTYGSVEVLVENITVYGPTAQSLTSGTLTLEGLTGVPGDTVDVSVIVLGRTSALGAASNPEFALDVVADDIDADAQTYINAQYAAGNTIDGSGQSAISQAFIDLKADTNYTGLIQIVPLWWGNATYNAIAMKGSNVTFTGLTTNAKSMTGNGTTGKLQTGSVMSTNGMTSAGCGAGFLLSAVASEAMGLVYGADPGGGSQIFHGGINYTGLGNFFSFGSFGQIQVTGDGTKGLYLASKLTETTSRATRYDGTQNTVGTGGGAAFTLPALEVYFFSQNNNGSVQDPSTRTLGLTLLFNDQDTTQLDSLANILYSLAAAFGAT